MTSLGKKEKKEPEKNNKGLGRVKERNKKNIIVMRGGEQRSYFSGNCTVTRGGLFEKQVLGKSDMADYINNVDYALRLKVALHLLLTSLHTTVCFLHETPR